MDPPSYTPPAPISATVSPPPRRSIQDLRAQIIANGSVMRLAQPGYSSRSSDDHIELVVAQLPPPDTSKSTNRKASSSFGASGSLEVPEKAPQRSSDPTAKPKHYACLLRRAKSGRTIKIIYQSDPKDTVEEALEALLEYTERGLHQMITQYGWRDDGGGCCVT